MEKVAGHVRYLVDNGLIFEINRKVLHPLGLALEVGIHPENSKWIAINGLVKVDDGDEEGFLYDEESYRVGMDALSAYMEKEGNKKLELRKQKLGFVIQELQEEKVNG